MTYVSKMRTVIVFAFGLFLATPVLAGWKLLPSNSAVHVGSMTVKPTIDWNQASARPGKQGVAWTRDGFALNGIELFAAVPAGQSLYKERNKKRNPMPKFDKTMLLPDLADFFEKSFRVQYQLSDFSILSTVPAQFGGHKGLAIRYTYSYPNDDLVRSGIARLAVADGKLFVANYYAPKLHYFDAGLSEAEAIMSSAKF